MTEAVSPRIAVPRTTSSWPRFAFTVTTMLLHVLLGLLIVACVFPLTTIVNRRRLMRWWSGRILTILRITLRVSGPLPSAARAAIVADALRAGGRGAMLVMNHVSWLDIFIVHSLRPAHFIAKAEIARWPLLGYLVDRTGAIFIERGKRHAVRDVNHRVSTMLREGELVGMFPEGTTSDGSRLLPFHANLIQPALDAGAPIVVAGVGYRDRDGGPSTATLYTGDIDMVQSLLRLARHAPITAELHLIDAIEPVGRKRHDIGREARTLIAAALGFDDEAHEVAKELETADVVAGLSPSFIPRFGPASASADIPPGTPSDPRDELL